MATKEEMHPLTGEPRNSRRAAWGLAGLDAFARETFGRGFEELLPQEGSGTPLEETDAPDCLSDLLCDLMHLSALRGLDFEGALARGRRNFDDEVGQERAADGAA